MLSWAQFGKGSPKPTLAFCEWGNWEPEKGNDLSKSTELGVRRNLVCSVSWCQQRGSVWISPAVLRTWSADRSLLLGHSPTSFFQTLSPLLSIFSGWDVQGWLSKYCSSQGGRGQWQRAIAHYIFTGTKIWDCLLWPETHCYVFLLLTLLHLAEDAGWIRQLYMNKHTYILVSGLVICWSEVG